MTHCFLQLTINPEAGENSVILTASQTQFTVKTYEPRLDRQILWGHRTPYRPELLYRILVQLFSYPVLLLDGGSGSAGFKLGIIPRVVDIELFQGTGGV